MAVAAASGWSLLLLSPLLSGAAGGTDVRWRVPGRDQARGWLGQERYCRHHPQARTRAVKVKVAAQVQPVIPAGPPGSPFVPVEFTGLTVTPYVNQAGRLAYSIKATGIRAPGRGRPGGEVREVAA